MFINFIGINDKILNLNSIVLIEDRSDDDHAEALVTTLAGDELTFVDEDATSLLDRCVFLMELTDNLTAQAQQAAANISNQV